MNRCPSSSNYSSIRKKFIRQLRRIITPAIKHVKTRHAGLDPASRKYSMDTVFRRYDRLQYLVAGVITEEGGIYAFC